MLSQLSVRVDALACLTIQSIVDTPTNPERHFAYMLKSLAPRLTAPLRRIRRAFSQSRVPILAQSDYDQMRRVMLK